MKKLDPRSVIIGFLVAVIGFMSMGATNNTFDSITVGEIILKDETVHIRDKNLKPIFGINASETNNSFFFYNAESSVIAGIGQDDGGSGIISVYTNGGQETIQLYQTDEDGGIISVNNNAGQEIIQLGQTINHDGTIKVYNSAGLNTIQLGHSDSGKGIVSLFNKYQKEVVYLATTKDAEGHIILADRYGKGQWDLTGKRK